MLEIKDEIIEGSPRYNVTDNADGTKNIELANDVIQQGTPLNKAMLDNMLGDLYTSDRYSLITPTISEESDLITPPESTRYMWVDKTATTSYCVSADAIFDGAVINTSSTQKGSASGPLHKSAWRSETESESWWKIEFKKPVRISKMYFGGGSSHYIVQGRNNSEWITLHEYNGESTFELQNQGKYLEYRIYWADRTSYVDLSSLTFDEIYIPRCIFESDIPLSSYEEGKKVNIRPLPIIDTIVDYTEEEFTSPVQPYFTSNDDAENKYGIWKINGGVDYSDVWKAFDSDGETYTGTSLDVDEIAHIQIGEEVFYGENTWAIKPREIKLDFSHAKIDGVFGFDYNEKKWVRITTGGSTDSGKKYLIFNLPNEERYFSAFKVVLSRYSSSYNYGRVYKFEISAGYIRYGTAVTRTQQLFANAYLKVGALPPQKINGFLYSNVNYSLTYNNGKWEIENIISIQKEENVLYEWKELKGSAKFALLKPTSGASTYMVLPGNENVMLDGSSSKSTMASDGTCVIISRTDYTGIFFY